MHVRRSFLGWGVFLILAGAVPLAARAGYLSDDQLGRLWQLWPLILIGIGIGLLLSRTRFGLIGGLIVAATLGLMVGGVLSVGVATATGGLCGGGTTPFDAQEGAFTSDPATISIDLDCGELAITTEPGDAWRIDGQGPDGVGPSVVASGSSLRVESVDRTSAPAWLGASGGSWNVALPQGPHVDLDVRVNAGEATIDLAGAVLGSVTLQANAGKATLDLGTVAAIEAVDLDLNAGTLGIALPQRSMTGSIRADAGSVRICVPPDVGLRLTTGGSLSGFQYADHGLVQDGATWTSQGFDAATVRIELETIANLGSFTLDPEDGCG